MTPDEIADGLEDSDEVGSLAQRLNAAGVHPRIWSDGTVLLMRQIGDLTDKICAEFGIDRLYRDYTFGGDPLAVAEALDDEAWYHASSKKWFESDLPDLNAADDV